MGSHEHSKEFWSLYKDAWHFLNRRMTVSFSRTVYPGFSYPEMKLVCFLLTGEVISEKDRCSTCHGKKVVNETKILDVHIDKGMREGQKIYFRGEGDQQVRMMELHIISILNCSSPLWFWPNIK
jgi:hypothetical protein